MVGEHNSEIVSNTRIRRGFFDYYYYYVFDYYYYFVFDYHYFVFDYHYFVFDYHDFDNGCDAIGDDNGCTE